MDDRVYLPWLLVTLQEQKPRTPAGLLGARRRDYILGPRSEVKAPPLFYALSVPFFLLLLYTPIVFLLLFIFHKVCLQ